MVVPTRTRRNHDATGRAQLFSLRPKLFFYIDVQDLQDKTQNNRRGVYPVHPVYRC